MYFTYVLILFKRKMARTAFFVFVEIKTIYLVFILPTFLFTYFTVIKWKCTQNSNASDVCFFLINWILFWIPADCCCVFGVCVSLCLQGHISWGQLIWDGCRNWQQKPFPALLSENKNLVPVKMFGVRLRLKIKKWLHLLLLPLPPGMSCVG